MITFALVFVLSFVIVFPQISWETGTVQGNQARRLCLPGVGMTTILALGAAIFFTVIFSRALPTVEAKNCSSEPIILASLHDLPGNTFLATRESESIHEYIYVTAMGGDTQHRRENRIDMLAEGHPLVEVVINDESTDYAFVKICRHDWAAGWMGLFAIFPENHGPDVYLFVIPPTGVGKILP